MTGGGGVAERGGPPLTSRAESGQSQLTRGEFRAGIQEAALGQRAKDSGPKRPNATKTAMAR